MSPTRNANPVDSHLDALRHGDRRELLVTLLRTGRPVERPVGGSDERAIAMGHVHLPKLAEGEYIAPDWETRVRPGPRFGELVPLLEAITYDRGGLSMH